MPRKTSPPLEEAPNLFGLLRAQDLHTLVQPILSQRVRHKPSKKVVYAQLIRGRDMFRILVKFGVGAVVLAVCSTLGANSLLAADEEAIQEE